jgi:hypothetical protein
VTRRPIEITILSLYLMIVFSLSAVGSVFGAAKDLAPYTTTEWLMLMIPKVIAIAAGIALWRMLRIGAWLWFGAALLGWVNAIGLGTGFFPSHTIASVVSLVILGFSLWAVARNWSHLRPLRGGRPEVAQ